MSGRAKCQPGCGCGKHRRAVGRSACLPGCSCKRHDRPRKVRWDSIEDKRRHDREYARMRRELDPESNREAARRWAAKNPGYRIAYKYGMSLQDWEDRLVAQAYCCYLCSEPFGTVTPDVDHDHACCRGERSCGTCIRGLACRECNRGIGHFGEDPERLRRVADSLEMANAALRDGRTAQFTEQAPA